MDEEKIKKKELKDLCRLIGEKRDNTYDMGKMEFSLHAASIFTELSTHTDMELGKKIMYSSIFAEIQALENTRLKILNYRDYHFWSKIAINKAFFISTKLDSKVKKVKEYSASMFIPSSVENCFFWADIKKIVNINLQLQ